MDTTKMTVGQITSLLSQKNITLDIIETLRNDVRLSVKRLVTKWESNQQKVQQEKERLHTLFENERQLCAQGYTLVAGVDEVGRGPLAGPVVVAAVILPLDCYLPGLNDSKKLTAGQREKLYEQIKNTAIAVSSSVISVETIDDINIYQATILGMYQAVSELAPVPQAVLIDAVPLPKLKMPYKSIIGGDQLSASIAAASIIAKVERDQIMNEIDSGYPMYGFSRNKGYGTEEHMNALSQYGACVHHRKSFAPVKAAVEAIGLIG